MTVRRGDWTWASLRGLGREKGGRIPEDMWYRSPAGQHTAPLGGSLFSVGYRERGLYSNPISNEYAILSKSHSRSSIHVPKFFLFSFNL